MKIRNPPLILAALYLCAHLSMLSAQNAKTTLDQDRNTRVLDGLRAAFPQFPLLAPAASGKAQGMFHTPPAMKPVVIDNVNYYGYRVKTPPREDAGDFIWAMITPSFGRDGFYLVTEEGEAIVYDNHYIVSKTNYLNAHDLPPLDQNELVIRTVSGDSLNDGETFLMWWMNKPPDSLAFNFVRLEANPTDPLPSVEKALGLVRASRTPVVLLNAPPAPGQSREEILRASFLQFPLLSPATDKKGKPKFQTLPAMPPVTMGTNKYYGFRFRAPNRHHAEDFVWGIIRPFGLQGWAILAEKEEMHGFESYLYVPRTNYAGTARLRPLRQKQMYLQSLSGQALVDGDTYLIWWNSTRESEPVSVIFTFTDLGPDRVQNQLAPLEKALGLSPVHPSPPAAK